MAAHPGSRPDPTHLMRLSTAFWESQVFLTANRIGLFALLADGPRPVGEIAGGLGTHPRPTELLLKACVALELLTLEGGQYGNAPAADAFLVPGKPGFMGSAFRYSDNLYDTWGQLESALRENRPPLATEAYLGGYQGMTRDFVYAMHERAIGAGRALVGLVDLGGRQRLLDIGGGPGTYAALFAQAHPALSATVIDLPGIARHAADIVAGMGVGERVELLPGDFKQTPFPDGRDVVLISGVFHRESEASCRELIARAYRCLQPGGLMIVSDVFTDRSGTGPLLATLFGLNMMLTAPDGGIHADAAVADWMAEAGFGDVTCRSFPPPMPHRLVQGVKPA